MYTRHASDRIPMSFVNLVLSLSLVAAYIVPAYPANSSRLPGRATKSARQLPASSKARADAKSIQPRVRTALDKLSVSFEANQGQADSKVKYLARGKGACLFLT